MSKNDLFTRYHLMSLDVKVRIEIFIMKNDWLVVYWDLQKVFLQKQPEVLLKISQISQENTCVGVCFHYFWSSFGSTKSIVILHTEVATRGVL